MEARGIFMIAGAAIALLLAACAPITRTRTSIEFTPYAPNELRQEKDGITVEIGERRVADDPTFKLRVFQCNTAGQILLGADRQPIVVTGFINGPGQFWRQVQITNRTRHVLRLNSVVLRLFDPGATQYEPLTFDDIRAELGVRHPCGITPASEAAMRTVKIFNRNIEIVPETTSSFWVAFKPTTQFVEGVWKFAAYEIPSVVDEAGRPTRTVRFEMRLLAKITQVTTTQNSPFEAPKVVTSPSQPAAATGPSTSIAAPTAASPGRTDASAAQAPGTSATPQTPARASSSVLLNRETIAHAQAKLNELSFNAGAPDGQIGPRTRDAIRKFQSAKKLKVSGELDLDTLSALGIQ